MIVCVVLNQEIGGHTMDNELWLTTAQLTTLNQILDSISKNGHPCITVILENEVYSHGPQVKAKLLRMADGTVAMTLEPIPVAKSSSDPISSVTSQKSLYEETIPSSPFRGRYGSHQY